MPKIARKPKRPLPNRTDNLSLRGVKFEDALRAAMNTPPPPPREPIHKHAEDLAEGACPVCRRGAKGEEE